MILLSITDGLRQIIHRNEWGIRFIFRFILIVLTGSLILRIIPMIIIWPAGIMVLLKRIQILMNLRPISIPPEVFISGRMRRHIWCVIMKCVSSGLKYYSARETGAVLWMPTKMEYVPIWKR